MGEAQAPCTTFRIFNKILEPQDNTLGLVQLLAKYPLICKLEFPGGFSKSRDEDVYFVGVSKSNNRTVTFGEKVTVVSGMSDEEPGKLKVRPHLSRVADTFLVWPEELSGQSPVLPS